ncbi:MAG: DUF4301 family protein, partial [Bacteroidota bacterium]
NDGILKLTEEETNSFISIYDNSQCKVVKFVPASGAATRMFKQLYEFLEEHATSGEVEGEQVKKFFDEIDEFAFYNELNSLYQQTHQQTIKEAIANFEYGMVIDFLLNEKGMNYGNLPKGLLSFHNYDSYVRTAAQEQIDEGIKYAQKENSVHIHFTVSLDHLKLFTEHVSNTINDYGSELDIHVSFSNQKESTDTLASTTEFDPFRSETNELLFRPAGHGALIENLNDLDADLIFIKNIDNVVPDRLKQDTINYKKALAGILLKYQERTFDLLNRLDSGENVYEEANSLLKEMGTFGDFSEEELRSFLNRPLRVCGMVKNEGEPGGGPFWVDYGKYKSLQIVESAQINQNDADQMNVFKSGTHFNPVDVVCSKKNYLGKKFDLLQYRDEEAGFISEKSANGRKLLAMELPGLWNGGMANWNTVFVEVPLITFNPVKTVMDLLKPNHQA